MKGLRHALGHIWVRRSGLKGRHSQANLKDENYFAHAASGLHELVPEHGLLTGESGNGLTGEAYFIKRGAISPLNISRDGCGSDYCFLPVKVPSPNCPSDTFPLIVLPSVLPEYFTARVPPCPSTLYSIVTSSPLTVPVTCASPS